MASARRKRMRAQTRIVDVLLRQLEDNAFPATVVIHRCGRLLAHLICERDYQEVTGLMAEHLKHLADEGEKNAIPLEDVLAWLERKQDERRQPRQIGGLVMYGCDVTLKRAYPYNMEMVELAGGACDFMITSRLLGIAADTYAYPLYQHLRPRLGLPRWRRLMCAPQTIPGIQFVRHTEVTGLARYATVVALDGAELELYYPKPTLAGTLYTFDLDYRTGMYLLEGLSYHVLANVSLWFDHSASPLAITFEQYLRMIALAGVR